MHRAAYKASGSGVWRGGGKEEGAACGEAEGSKRSKYLAMCSAQHINSILPADFRIGRASSCRLTSYHLVGASCIHQPLAGPATLAEERGERDLREKWSKRSRLSISLQEENARLILYAWSPEGSPEGSASVARSPEEEDDPPRPASCRWQQRRLGLLGHRRGGR